MTRSVLDPRMPEDAIPGSRVRAATKHGALTVDDIAEMQPGGARLMDEFGRRYWALYYAAKSGNWDLARYMEKESERVLAILGKVRPKYAEDLGAFVKETLGAMARAIEAKDWTSFDVAYLRGIEESDRYHVKYAKGFIRFRVPDHPPEWLDLSPR